MINESVVVVAVVLLTGLLIGEKKENSAAILGFKTPLSCLFVITALMQPHPLPAYYHFVLGGLILGLVGDVSLAFPGESAFRVGLLTFLFGHILYIFAFANLARSSEWLSPVHLIFVSVSVLVFWWLRPRLGGMLVPVIMYVIVITVMLSAAWCAFRNRVVMPSGAWALFAGAVAFYLSDLFVARDRFVTHQFLNRLIGLPLYYGGQFLLAFSVGLVG
jgi:uncharacterized membrane protein YhhN